MRVIGGLKNILDRVLLPYQFDSQEMRNKNVETIKITAEVIDDGADPVLIFKKEIYNLNSFIKESRL